MTPSCRVAFRNSSALVTFNLNARALSLSSCSWILVNLRWPVSPVLTAGIMSGLNRTFDDAGGSNANEFDNMFRLFQANVQELHDVNVS